MKKILEFFSTKVFKQVGDVVDNLFTSEEERLNARNQIFKVLQDAQLELQKQLSAHLITPVLEPEFWSLLEIGIGGYVIGRSGEKIVDKLGPLFKK